jgi:hypothetical protein
MVKWAILCGMSLGMALALLAVTLIIYFSGNMAFAEPRQWVLYYEMGILVAIIGYTIWLTTKIRRE